MPKQSHDEYSLLRSHNSRLITAAAYVNQNFLGTSYGSTPVHQRLLNQRFLMELTAPDKNKIYTHGNFFTDEYGKKIELGFDQIQQANIIFKVSVEKPTNPALNSITYEEASFAIFNPLSVPSTYKNKEKEWPQKREAFLKACDQGLVKVEPNVEALQKNGMMVNHVIHRPNHGLHHSLRVAASVPTILGFLEKNATAAEIEKAQLMMLFSVVGREDETGFRETGEWGKGKETYQRFRTTSGLAYLDYCKTKEGIYTAEEKETYLDYRHALAVELMGFSDVKDAIGASKVSLISDKDWLKDRILKDTKRLVEMETLTLEEADLINKAQNKDDIVDALIHKISDPKQERYILHDTIPGVLVRFIEENHTKLALPKTMRDAIEQAPNKTEIIKTFIPKILAEKDKCQQIFPFLFSNNARNKINADLSIMNWAHGLDLSRCYPLEAKYDIKVIAMPTGIKPNASNWESILTTALDTQHQKLLKDMDKNQGMVIIKSATDLFYVRHLNSAGEIRFSEISKNKNPDLVDLLNHTPAPKTLQMRQLLLAIADKEGQLPHKSQYFDNVQSMVNLAFSRSGGDWENFKMEMDKLYDFFNTIQDAQIKTGERISFKLCAKQDFFKNFIDLPETEKKYKEFEKTPKLFAKKFTATMLPQLYDATNKQSYTNQAFRIFNDTPDGIKKRDYLAEATNCARLIDSVSKPKEALKMEGFPEIKALNYDPKGKKMHLSFATEEEAGTFQDLYKEVNKKSADIHSDGLHVAIPLEPYKYLRDNRYLKFQLETVPEKHSEEENFINPETGEYRALQLIKQQQAVVRLHNTVSDKDGKHAYDSELTAMNNPGNARHVAATPSHLATFNEQRKYEERKNIRVPLTGAHISRKEHVEVSPPDPRYQQPALRELDHPDLASNAIYLKQGGAKNTRFLGKAAYTLLNPEGKTPLFMGAVNKRHLYFPIGILSDVNFMHKGGEKFIWKENATSWGKQWLGIDKHSNFKEGVSLDELRKQQQNGDASEKQNELLLRGAKEAIRALVAPKNTLFNRLNLAAQALQIKEKYNITAPLIILDPSDPTCPKAYTEQMIRNDLQEAVQNIRKHQLPYDNSFVTIHTKRNGPDVAVQKDKELQNELIKQLLQKCGFVVSLSKNTSLPVADKLIINPKNLVKNDSKKIDTFLQKLSVPGGIYAEIQQISDLDFNNLAKEKKDNFFIKQVALGNTEVIDELLMNCVYKPNKDIFEKAGSVARHCHGDIQATQITERIIEILTVRQAMVNLKTEFKKIPANELGSKMLFQQMFENTKEALTQYKPINKDIIDQTYSAQFPAQQSLLDTVSFLKQSIEDANKVLPKTTTLNQLITSATELLESFNQHTQEKINMLTPNDKIRLQNEFQEEISNLFPGNNSFKDNVVNLVSGVRCQGSPFQQLELYLYKEQYNKNLSPINKPCADNMQKIAALLATTKEPESILKNMWEGHLSELTNSYPLITCRVAIEKYQLANHGTKRMLGPQQINNLVNIVADAMQQPGSDTVKKEKVSQLIMALDKNDSSLVAKIATNPIDITNFKAFKTQYATLCKEADPIRELPSLTK